MRRISFAAALATVAVVSPLSAQTWQAIGTPSNTPLAVGGNTAYWNNQSFGTPAGSVCNVGAVLTTTLTAACPNQSPVGLLPLTPLPLNSGNVFLGGNLGSQPGAFQFAAGSYSFSRIGNVAGAGQANWGIIIGNMAYANPFAAAQALTGPFALWVTATNGMTYTSDLRSGTIVGGLFTGMATTLQQHTVFTNSRVAGSAANSSAGMTTVNYVGGAEYFSGMEDLANGGRGFGSANGVVSDRDYQDVLIRIQAVPEPATIGLMGFGLLALAGVAKRRKA